MGLDASAYAVNGSDRHEFFYWRNHHDMNRCILAIDYGECPKKYLESESFLGVQISRPVYLGKSEIDAIEMTIPLMSYNGGGRYQNSMQKDIEFCKIARKYIDDGYSVEYKSF